MIESGKYYDHLRRYIRAFDKSKLKIFLTEDLKNNSELTISELCAFLNVQMQSTFIDNERNTAALPRFMILNRLLNKHKNANAVLKNLITEIPDQPPGKHL